ncbi:hypothetical protein LUZ60_007456 [Juncus effusus]|nr:hypothetical protein LUZ60_007456 [Juncus effusus]
MSSNRRKFVVRHPVVVDIGCSCRKPKIPSFITNSLPKLPKSSKKLRNRSPFFSSSSAGTTRTTISTASQSSLGFSAPESPVLKPLERKKRSKKGVKIVDQEEAGVAVVKESSNPYVDFKDSMLQMIIEMEIYAWDDLRELLHRFLTLNSPCHHQYILRAFAEIWTEVFSPSISTTNYY